MQADACQHRGELNPHHTNLGDLGANVGRAESSRVPSMSVQLSSKLERNRPKPMFPICDQARPNLDPNLAEFGPVRPDSVELRKIWDEFGQLWPDLAKFGPRPTNPGQMSTNIGKFWPISCAESAKYDNCWDKSDPCQTELGRRPKLGRPITAHFGPNSTDFGPPLSRFRATGAAKRVDLKRSSSIVA